MKIYFKIIKDEKELTSEEVRALIRKADESGELYCAVTDAQASVTDDCRSIVTYWSGFSYAVLDDGIVQYDGAVNGFMRQELLPEFFKESYRFIRAESSLGNFSSLEEAKAFVDGYNLQKYGQKVALSIYTKLFDDFELVLEGINVRKDDYGVISTTASFPGGVTIEAVIVNNAQEYKIVLFGEETHQVRIKRDWWEEEGDRQGLLHAVKACLNDKYDPPQWVEVGE